MSINSQKKPWEDNANWKNGQIQSSNNKVKYYWLFAFFWNLISAPMLFVGIPEMLEQEKHLNVLFFSFFPITGIFLLIFSIYKTLQSLKYSDSLLEMEKIPGVIGGKFLAKLHLPKKLNEAQEISVQLKCTRYTVTGSGKNRQTRRFLLWQTRQLFLKDDWSVKISNIDLNIDFTIPFATEESNQSNINDKVLWHLEVYAAMPGIDYLEQFEVPVYKTNESDANITVDEQQLEKILSRPPHMKGITYEELEDGIRIFVHPFTFWFSGLILLAISTILGGATLFLYLNNHNYIAIIPGLIGLLLLIFGIHFTLIQTEILFKEKFAQIKTTWLGLGIIREFELNSIKEIRVKIISSSQSDFGRDHYNYTLELIPHEGRSLSLSEMTSNYEQALWMAAKLNEKLNS